MTTTEKTIRKAFRGRDNAGLRAMIRECETAEDVEALRARVALTNRGEAGLRAVAETLPRWRPA